MKLKFDSKKYTKDRIYNEVAPRISRYLYWNEDHKEYLPANGRPYRARRYTDGKREDKFFSTLKEARDWQNDDKTDQPKAQGLVFQQILEDWRRKKYPSLAPSTRRTYDKISRLYFESLAEVHIEELTPKRIDQWIELLKDPEGRAMNSPRRKSFDHELSLLSTVLKHYESYNDDAKYQFPIKERHKEAICLNRPSIPKDKNLTEANFMKFREALLGEKEGKTFAVLATLQYYHALRISEAGGIHWEDIQFNFESPERSKIRIVRKLAFKKDTGVPTAIVAGFKNAEANNGLKEHLLFPEAHEALIQLHQSGAIGPVFSIDGQILEYRQIQWAYDKAFALAGLPYTATHIMRHGGCRHVYDETSDLEIAKQHLGNKSVQSTMVYAQRESKAFDKVVLERWKKKQEKDEGGCNWVQEDQEKIIRELNLGEEE